jgi:hypothetical protein
MKLGEPYELQIKPISGKKRFLFLLRFSKRTQPVEFEMTTADAMSIMKALQKLQAVHKLAIPHDPTAKRGKPTLSIVRDAV